MHHVLICGSREWRDVRPIKSILERLQAEHGLELLVVEGGAPGADMLAGTLCATMGIDYCVFPANWKGRYTIRNGRVSYWAGPFRNRLMLDVMQPAEVFAFHPFIQASKGTKDMVDECKLREIPVTVVAG